MHVMCRLFRIEGRVQGVWFRESTRRQAEKLGVRGYARNMPDGSVEVLACASIEILEQLHGWLKKGPPLARVSQVRYEKTQLHCPSAFTTG